MVGSGFFFHVRKRGRSVNFGAVAFTFAFAFPVPFSCSAFGVFVDEYFLSNPVCHMCLYTNIRVRRSACSYTKI